MCLWVARLLIVPLALGVVVCLACHMSHLGPIDADVLLHDRRRSQKKRRQQTHQSRYLAQLI